MRLRFRNYSVWRVHVRLYEHQVMLNPQAVKMQSGSFVDRFAPLPFCIFSEHSDGVNPHTMGSISIYSLVFSMWILSVKRGGGREEGLKETPTPVYESFPRSE